jgi:SAM-dependent methyltransferase
MLETLNELSNEARTTCEAAGARFGVSGAVDPRDWMFWFLYNHANFPNKVDAIDEYFGDGADCAKKLAALIAETRPTAGARILEFAAGYGRVTRHLPHAMPEANVLACDIHAEAIAFLRETLGAKARGSVDVPEKFYLDQQFDVVFALSFFSHLPDSSFRRWLVGLAEHTAPGGLLIFTTHGERTRKIVGNPAIGPDGFWFKPESEQQDLAGKEYGTTVSLPAYVFAQIAGIPGMRIVRFQEGFWWEHQDVYVLRRQAEPPRAGAPHA